MIFIIQPFIYIWIYILICVIILPISIIALPFSQNRRVALTTPFWNLFFKLIMRTAFFCKIEKIDERDLKAKKSISPKGLYISNHKSFVDIPLLFSVFVIPPIMKKEVLYIPIFGICAYSAGGILVDRKDKNSRQKVFGESKKRLLYNREQLQYYPEGTRQRNNAPVKEVSEIKTKLIEFAFENAIKVYPISVEGTQHCMLNHMIIPGRKVGIHLHSPLDPKDFKSQEEFVNKCWEKVIMGKKQLESKIYS